MMRSALFAPLLLVSACSSTQNASAPVDAGDEGLVPPTSPAGPPTAITMTHAYAIHHVFLGLTDRTSTPSKTAWQAFGYDLDGKATTATSTDVCTLFPGSPPATQDDGNGGIDNSFGENFAPLASVDQATTDAAIADGMFTTIFVVKGWDDANGSQTATGLTGVVLPGVSSHARPTWTVADTWPIDDTFVTPSTPGTDPIGGAKNPFSNAYVVDGTFVSAAPVDVPLRIALGVGVVPFVVHHAVVTWQSDGTGHLTNGTIAGVLSTAEVIANVFEFGGVDIRWTPIFCSFENPATGQQISQTSDILQDGTNRAGVACDAISIGLGFDADEVAVPVPEDVVDAPAMAINPCFDGGT